MKRRETSADILPEWWFLWEEPLENPRSATCQPWKAIRCRCSMILLWKMRKSTPYGQRCPAQVSSSCQISWRSFRVTTWPFLTWPQVGCKLQTTVWGLSHPQVCIIIKQHGLLDFNRFPWSTACKRCSRTFCVMATFDDFCTCSDKAIAIDALWKQSHWAAFSVWSLRKYGLHADPQVPSPCHLGPKIGRAGRFHGGEMWHPARVDIGFFFVQQVCFNCFGCCFLMFLVGSWSSRFL